MTNRTAITSILIVSGIAVGFLFWLIYGVEAGSAESQWSFLPATNACFNALSATAVCFGIWNIRRGNKQVHGAAMLIAFVASTLFLIGYIVHHTVHGDTRFVTEGILRPVYFAILISHVFLSIIVLPMVLTTFFLAAAKRWPAHRRLAKWTYPVWLYVSVTGVLVFVFLRYLNA